MGGDQNQVILATAGYDHTIRFWQAHSGICQRTVQHPDSQVNAMEITPDKLLLAAAGYQHIRMYDINSNNPNPVVNYDGVSKNVTSVGFHEDGRWMYTGGEDCSARIWDLRSRNLQCQRIFQANHPVNCVFVHPNQGELYVGDQSGIIHIWDLRTDQNEQLVTDPDVAVQYIHIDQDGMYLAAIDNKGDCYLFSLKPGNESAPSRPIRRIKLKAHQQYGLKCKFSPDSTLLVTTSADKSAKVWKTATLFHSLDEQKPSSESEKESPSPPPTSETITTEVRGWKVAEATPMVELKDPNQRWVWDAAFSSDSRYLLTASSDNLARLWNLSTGSVELEYTGHQKALTALAFKDGAH